MAKKKTQGVIFYIGGGRIKYRKRGPNLTQKMKFKRYNPKTRRHEEVTEKKA